MMGMIRGLCGEVSGIAIMAVISGFNRIVKDLCKQLFVWNCQ